MSATLVISNTAVSKLLQISLLNDRCSLKCSDDCSTLFVDPPDNTFVSTIDLCMKDNDGNEISAVSFSMGCTSGQQRIRTDGLFSIVFVAEESIAVVPEFLYDRYVRESMDECGKFEMAVNINLLDGVPDSFVSRTMPVPIHSGALKVADSTVPISKEILAVTSPFFNALFYGSFSVVQKDFFEIKEVDEDDFVWFINSILPRKWKFASVEQALVALTYADRFEMLYLHKYALPYLLKNNLPQDDIKDTLLLCDRFKDNEELIMWVLRQCKNVQTRADLVFECAPEMQKCSIIAAHKVLRELNTEAQNRASQAENRASQAENRASQAENRASQAENRAKQAETRASQAEIRASQAGDVSSALKDAYVNSSTTALICLKFYDVNGIVERETYFTTKLDSFKEFRYSILRDRIPQQYTVIKTEAPMRTLASSGSQYYKVPSPKIVDVHAHRR